MPLLKARVNATVTIQDNTGTVKKANVPVIIGAAKQTFGPDGVLVVTPILFDIASTILAGDFIVITSKKGQPGYVPGTPRKIEFRDDRAGAGSAMTYIKCFIYGAA